MKLYKSNKKKMCKICFGDIEPEEECVQLETRISPHYCTLYFCLKCIRKKFIELNEKLHIV